MERLSTLYGKLLDALALAACALLFLLMLMICADVLLRNVRIVHHAPRYTLLAYRSVPVTTPTVEIFV